MWIYPILNLREVRGAFDIVIEFKRADLEKFNPNYSSESEANRMNVRLTVRCSSGNPDLEIPNFGEYNEPKSVGIT